MNASELVTSLSQKGIRIWAENEKLNIRSPKGVVTPALRSEIAAHKTEILALLKQGDRQEICLENGLSLSTIGHLIGGMKGTSTRLPIIDARAMAQKVSVTFRPLPKRYKNTKILQFREALKQQLWYQGVRVVAWHEATRQFKYTLKLPILGWKKTIQIRTVKTSIDAVIDVERSPSLWSRAKNIAAEALYWLYTRTVARGQTLSIPRIAMLIGWAEEHAAKTVEDPTRTQVVMLTDLNPAFIHPQTSYRQKIDMGINALIRTFSEIMIGVSEDQISILNMNLSDSVFPTADLERFVAKSLIPKIFVPIAPLLLNQFEVGQYNPQTSDDAGRLVELGKALAPTGLFPPGFKLSKMIQRQSHRDIVDRLVNGRTGVSYGFVAYIKAPQYVGAPEIDRDEWETLAPVQGLSPVEVRQNTHGRRYAKVRTGNSGDRQSHRFRQIPDIWVVSARSGANKTHLDLNQDVLQIGLTNQLMLQLPEGTDPATDIKPSYDLYVMVAIALSAALYTPSLVENGAPIVHFHGYPSADWFKANEYWTGAHNPSVPCGTYESGIFNFLGLSSLTNLPSENIQLVSLIEPDHGANFIASDWEYLVERLISGCEQGQIELGGKHFRSLAHKSPAGVT
ncbi:hypothetical protein [Acaryochloris sp. IP29b_bin.137]|uniref:TubC N-terminal docking domain-related protein n=1 Tax=Acaryochloris sp. IP29b_bin.137 TaxID=2969217 RepID=UPI00261FB847|nr:hypothetical protein [Acaryochloris sp. IP29b_bin.137]